jgi:iron complex outermembrane receptor protein
MKQITIFFSLILISFQSIAQDSNVIILNRVLVTAVRADKKTPVTQKTIGDTALQYCYQGQEIPVLLSSLPAMNSNSDGGHAQGYTYLSLRGAGQARINMTLNSVPLNEPEDHGVYTSNFPSFITAIQSIQIQRGVGTSSNGTASFIGSINFQTKSGLVKNTEIQLGGGSYNTARFNISTSTGLLKNNIALFANIGGIRTDGFRRNSGSRGGSIFISGGYYGTKRITKFTMFSGFSKNQMAWDGSDESVLVKDYRDNPRGNDNTDLFNQTHVQLQNINTFNPKSKLTSTVFYNRLGGQYDVYNIKEVKTIGYYANENQKSNWFGYITQYDYRVKDFKIAIGLSANTYTRNHNGVEFYDSVTSFNYKNTGQKNELSGFVKVSLDVENTTYYVDFQQRYVNFKYSGDVAMDTKLWSFFNPKGGIRVALNNNTDVYFAVGASHREPTRSVMFGGGLYLTKLNNVKPEEVIDYELGLNLRTSRLKLQADLYYMDFSNEIIPVGPSGANSLPIMVNVNKSLRMGFEADLEYKISDVFTYAINTTLSYNSYGDEGNQPIFTPPLMVNHSLEYNKNNLSVNLSQSYISKMYTDLSNNNTTPSYTILGLNVIYSFENYSISLQGNNLTNAKYYSNGYMSGNTKYLFPNAQFNYYVTLRIKL